MMILIFLLKSSETSSGVTGLVCEDLFALGIAKGKLILFKIDLIIELLGNLIATVSKFDVAKSDNLFFFFFLSI